MIHPDGFRGAAFGTAAEGDVRRDEAERQRFAEQLGIPSRWAFVHQVHGARTELADRPGDLGDADAIVVKRPGLPVSVATADCIPVVIEGDAGAAVVHAGWRGVVSGVVVSALDALQANGVTPIRAAIGPGIGPCCYEVGDEVADKLPDHVAQTTWGTRSVDLPGAVASQLGDLVTFRSEACTYTSAELHSYRRDQTKLRQVAVAWLPNS
jgi:YfiH family protein